MHINAVTDPATLKIEAAISSLPPNVRRLMTLADINLGGKTISVADIDRKLAASDASDRRMSTIDKLSLKLGLNRAGLLVD
jgi:hypothetical protein